MRNKRSLFVDSLVGQIGRHVWLAVAGGVAIVLLLSIGLHFVNRNFSLSISENKKIELTPTQIRAIESIGEWEFLTITDEELVDTLRHGFFGDSELVRIYYGTLRLGFDLKDAAPGWLKVDHDTIKPRCRPSGCSTKTSSTRPRRAPSMKAEHGTSGPADGFTTKPTAPC